MASENNNSGESAPTGSAVAAPDAAKPAFYNDPKVRAIFYQAVLLAAVAWFGYSVFGNMRANMDARGIQTGFGFLGEVASFDIGFTLIEYDRSSTYMQTLYVGLLNTLLVAVLGIIFATILGFTLGIARLSNNWIVARIATVYIETLRNIPLLLQMFFWYFGVLSLLPGVKQSLELPFNMFFNNRGIVTPAPIFSPGFSTVVFTLVVAIIGAIFIARWAKKKQQDTGEQPPAFFINLVLIVGLPTIVYFATGASLTFTMPELRGFNFKDGIIIPPELIALLWALILYTATFIAEIVRSGILAVPAGQTEAAQSLGIKDGDRLRQVVIPQALRVIIPPLTSQYLNLTKNSSLAVAIGYPDLVSVFMKTTLNQSGRAVEVVLITMLIYLGLSLIISVFMNWLNARVALTER